MDDKVKTRDRLLRWLAVDTVATLVACVVVVFVFHAFNKFPAFYTRNVELKRTEAKVWESICDNGNAPHYASVDCDAARIHASMNVIGQTVEDVMMHVVEDIKGVVSIGWLCEPGSVCHHVFWSALHYALTNWMLLLIVAAAFAAFYMYSVNYSRNLYFQYKMLEARGGRGGRNDEVVVFEPQYRFNAHEL